MSRLMSNAQMSVGFIGLGAMGEPMALNLVRSGRPLLVWNRSRSKSETLAKAGAKVAKDPAEVFERCEIVILMLVDGQATDEVLGRHHDFAKRIKDRTIVNMATTAAGYSAVLECDIRNAGGNYVEAPVSGSRKPAEAGQLIAMLAGEPSTVSKVRPILAPMCRESVVCGSVPNALFTKLAVNLFLTAVVTGLAEAMHFAENHKLDLATFVSVLDAGPMASDVSRIKAAKLLAQDFSSQASIANVLENVRLISDAARNSKIASPILDICHDLYREAYSMNLKQLDMVSVVEAIRKRTKDLTYASFPT